MTRCENCGGEMIPYHSVARFCSRRCSDAWFCAERREAVKWYRAAGMRPELRNDQQEEQEA
jgi:hypothetical protein